MHATFETIAYRRIENLLDLQSALDHMPVGLTLHGSQIYIEGATTVALIEHTLTDGSKVYSIRFTDKEVK